MGLKEEKLYLDRIEQRNKEIDKATQNIERKWHRKINNSIKKVEQVGCQHHFYTMVYKMTDNGYGHWWRGEIKTCKVCGQSDTYHEWPLNEKTN